MGDPTTRNGDPNPTNDPNPSGTPRQGDSGPSNPQPDTGGTGRDAPRTIPEPEPELRPSHND